MFVTITVNEYLLTIALLEVVSSEVLTSNPTMCIALVTEGWFPLHKEKCS